MSKVYKTPLFIAVIAIATFIVVGPLLVSLDTQNVFAIKKSDSAAQGLVQGETSAQSSAVLSENGTTATSGNNVDLSFNLSDGKKNALGQK